MSLSKTILVVDDDPEIIALLLACFEHAGYQVTTATNAQQAFKQVNENRPDIILLDQVMPGIDGFEVAQKLKADKTTATIPVVMLTAKGTVEDMAEGWNSAVDLYLIKPIELPELLSIVQSILQ